jgi:hypothetical protein
VRARGQPILCACTEPTGNTAVPSGTLESVAKCLSESSNEQLLQKSLWLVTNMTLNGSTHTHTHAHTRACARALSHRRKEQRAARAERIHRAACALRCGASTHHSTRGNQACQKLILTQHDTVIPVESEGVCEGARTPQDHPNYQVRMHTHTHTHTHIHTRIHTRTHAYTYACIHTQEAYAVAAR